MTGGVLRLVETGGGAEVTVGMAEVIGGVVEMVGEDRVKVDAAKVVAAEESGVAGLTEEGGAAVDCEMMVLDKTEGGSEVTARAPVVAEGRVEEAG